MERKSKAKNKPVIGMDFGNCYSFLSYISDFDDKTRLGGNVHDLLPAGLNEGIPSVFFYSEETGILCGDAAVRGRAKPVENRVNRLKRHLGETMTLDGKEISYDEAITEVIQHCVRAANKKLQSGWQMTTNEIALSYPATYTSAQRQRLIELAEKASLADGTQVHVSGTIAEPAAAGLDYLAKFGTNEDTIALVYDLGGGTFDLALVALYPKGRTSGDGDYYYDILDKDGLEDVGGGEFDDIMYELIVQKFQAKYQIQLNRPHEASLRVDAVKAKKELTSDTYTEVELLYNNEYLTVSITREEFEDASSELLMRTMKATENILNRHLNQKPEIIILTGGASQMPMVKHALDEVLPEYKDKIQISNPSRAIADGVARYGTAEAMSDIAEKAETASAVQTRVGYDIGIRFYHSVNDESGYISTYIPAGTPIPFQAAYQNSTTLHEDQRYSGFSVYEANKAHPNSEQVAEDYTEIMKVSLDHGRGVPKGTRNESRLCIDKLGVLTIEAHEADHPEKPIESTVELKNLSIS